MPFLSMDSLEGVDMRARRARRAMPRALPWLLPLIVPVMLSACTKGQAVGAPTPAGGPGGGPGGGPPRPGTAAVPGGSAAELQRLYRSMGLIAGSGSMAFVASASFLSSPSPDSTLVLLALSMPSRALGFTREGDRYVAEYTVRVEARSGATVAAQVDAKETVRVPTFRETSRTDESIIWQQYLRMAPGRYQLTIALKDESGLRNAAEEVLLEVPRLASGAVATPIGVYEAIPRSSVDSMPRLLARPRSTVVFGADSVYPIYLEATGADAPASVTVRVIGEGDQELWQAPIELTSRLGVRSATVAIPVMRLGVGVSNIVVSAAGRSDTARSRVMVSLGDDLPVATFEEMLGYLRYFASADKLNALRTAPPSGRSEAWAQFLRTTDPIPGTPEHEGLRDYFQRIRTANIRFRDDGLVGWQTDRGTAFLGLGEPDNIFDSSLQDPNARVRQQVWDYRALRINLVFLDQTGFGRWRLGPSERAEMDAAIRRKLAGQP
ncbi:MAG: GWxTD domain-containing protein [Gemmatimonadaceae bacterium]|nr:GWxTD domain-containing protein [Gemmatimonadaceae bacterium]